MAVEILVPSVFFATLFGIFFLYITARNKERMAMIEKGIDFKFSTPEPKSSAFLRYGFLALGIGIGWLIGMIIAPFIKAEGDLIVIATTLIFGGLFMIIGYFVDAKIKSQKESKDLLKLD